MNNLPAKNSISKLYQITALTAFIYSAILIVFSIYKQFFYIDGTWFHGFVSNGFSVLSGLIWIGVLLVFKQFLSKILNYNRTNLLLNVYIIFLAITTLSITSVLIKSIELYQSLNDTESINSLTAFATTSILGAIFVFISAFAIILICILLGNRLRKIDVVERNLFKILGFSFIVYGILSLLSSFYIIGSDIFQTLLKAGISILIGVILKKIYSMESSVLYSLTGFEKVSKLDQHKPKIQKSTFSKEETKKTEQVYPKINKDVKDSGKLTNLEDVELPNINLDEIENKESVISYYENLSKDELNRLESIVQRKYNKNLTNEQKKDLVIHYIAENKLNDYQRFMPK